MNEQNDITVTLNPEERLRDRLGKQWTVTLALARKEWYSYSISPAFYGVAIFFLLFTSIWFFQIQNFFQRGEATLRPYFAAFPLAFILVIPAITMRSWAEERKSGTAELLLTMPYSEWSLALGKFTGALGVILVLFILTLPVPLSLGMLGHFDGGVIFAEYFGAFLLSASAVALGLLLSALSKNQAAAFLSGAAVFVVIILIGQIPWTTSFPDWLNRLINYLALAKHFESFSKGLLDTRDIAYFVITAVLFLFLTVKVLVFRKWS